MSLNDQLNNISREGNLEAVKKLVAEGADGYNVAMAFAANGNHLKLVQYFLSLGANDYDTAIQGATLGGHPNIARYLESLKTRKR